MKIGDITGAEVVYLVEQVGRRSHSMARRCFQVLSHVYQHGIAKHMAQANPCHLGALGVDVIVAEKCLNHTLGGLIDTYDRGDYLPQRRKALELWASFLVCCEEGRPWKVTPLRREAA